MAGRLDEHVNALRRAMDGPGEDDGDGGEKLAA
jgi:hypothetical protein